jgi:hypothetical protein
VAPNRNLNKYIWNENRMEERKNENRMEERKLLLNRLKSYLDEEFSQIEVGGHTLNTKKGICYTASKVGSKILNGLGYKCNIHRVTVIVGNDIGRRIFVEQQKSGVYSSDELIKHGGWTIGLGVPPDSHYIIYIEGETKQDGEKRKGEILDITYGQANRPQYNIIADAYWESEDNMPNTIIEIHICNDAKLELDPIYHYPEFRKIFKKIIRKGIRILEKEGFSKTENKL